MNSYQLDQPLDLRLKALNLSRGFHQQLAAPHQFGGGNLVSAADCPQAAAHLQQLGGSPPKHSFCNGPLRGTCASSGGHVVFNPPPYARQQHHHSLYRPLTSHPSSLGAAPQQQPQATSVMLAEHNPHNHSYNNNNHQQHHHLNQQQQQFEQRPLGLVNIHCQPLNHHQPHPLSSRLQPAPPPTQPPQGNLSPAAGSPPSSRQASAASAHETSTLALAPSPAQLHCGPPSRSPTSPVAHQRPAAASLSTSPQQHMFHQHSLRPSPSHKHNLPAPPVRSLSMSGQLINPSHQSLMVPPTSASAPVPLSTAAAPSNLCRQTQIGSGGAELFQSPHAVAGQPGNRCRNGQTSPSKQLELNKQSSRQQLAADSSLDGSPQLSPASFCNSSPGAVLGSCSPKQAATISSSPPSSGSISSNAAAAAAATAAPILRQNSLTRYDCKPCGIAFSQPENLRAHQEGYCTKRNRGQSVQMRSRSAVSPTAIKQTASNSASCGK